MLERRIRPGRTGCIDARQAPATPAAHDGPPSPQGPQAARSNAQSGPPMQKAGFTPAFCIISGHARNAQRFGRDYFFSPGTLPSTPFT